MSDNRELHWQAGGSGGLDGARFNEPGFEYSLEGVAFGDLDTARIAERLNLVRSDFVRAVSPVGMAELVVHAQAAGCWDAGVVADYWSEALDRFLRSVAPPSQPPL